MIKLNDNNRYIQKFVKDLVEDAIENTNLETWSVTFEDDYICCFDCKYKGYKFEYTRSKKTNKIIAIFNVWQLDDAEDPIFTA